MNILRDVFQELVKMFLADFRQSISILLLVAFVAFLIKYVNVGALIAGGVLLVGCLLILVLAVLRQRKPV